MSTTDPDALLEGLRRLPGFADTAAGDLAALPVTGLAHAHIRLAGARVLLRVPRNSFMGLAPAGALAHQAAVFERLAPSGRVPGLRGLVPPGPGVPFGALVVEDVAGRPPRLPEDLEAMADALAAIHAVALPPRTARAPIRDETDPVAATLDLIHEQARHMEAARLAPECRAQIEDEMSWAEGFAIVASAGEQPRRLVLTDTQPGNFLVGPDGFARFVDLEKALYGAPSIDLAHASLRPSVGWDPACDTRLAMADVARFYRRYLAAAEPGYAAALRPWLAPMRRLTWLRTVTIFAKMKARHLAGTWSGAQLEPAFRDHVLAHIDRCHEPAAMTAMRAEWLEEGGLDAFL